MTSSRRPHQASKRSARGTPPADDHVRQEWLRRVEAEYRSGAHAQHLTLWLLQLGAPPELIHMGLGVVRDELSHAELSAGVYAAAGGGAAPELARDSLALEHDPSEPLELRVLHVGVEMFCLGETVAVRLFKRLRDASTVPVACTALDKILRDEVAHREFGWSLLAWLLSTPMAPQFRQRLERELPAMLVRVRDNYGGLLLAKLGPERMARLAAQLAPETRAWGVMPVTEYVDAVDEAFARDYGPRFTELGIAMPSR